MRLQGDNRLEASGRLVTPIEEAAHPAIEEPTYQTKSTGLQKLASLRKKALPYLIKTRDQIMQERQADVYFLHFDIFASARRAEVGKAKEQQLAWLVKHGVDYEIAAPSGWLEGDPGYYAVYFEGNEDPRLAAYSSAFEDAEGHSLDDGLYQMYLVLFDRWSQQSKRGSRA